VTLCSQCQMPQTQFVPKTKWCATCHQNYKKRKYQENLSASRYYTNQRRAARIQWFQQLKANIPCTDCGKIYDPVCLDYDHVPGRGIKYKNVSRMVLDNSPKEKILEEIKKCELVCVLCHNARTFCRLKTATAYKPHQQRNINIINQFKEQPCVYCGQQYPSYNMQMDHINPAHKLSNISQLKSSKVEILHQELAKCQVLCAVCHRLKSIIEQKAGKYLLAKSKIAKKRLYFDGYVKECGRCRQLKELSCFRKHQHTTSGYNTYCISCFNEYRRQRRANL
jgi:hypothetical protein